MSDDREHLRNWQAHVAAGRIGEGPVRSAELLRRHMRNERVLCPHRVREGPVVGHRLLPNGMLGPGE